MGDLAWGDRRQRRLKSDYFSLTYPLAGSPSVYIPIGIDEDDCNKYHYPFESA